MKQTFEKEEVFYIFNQSNIESYNLSLHHVEEVSSVFLGRCYMVCNEKPVPRQISFGFYLWKTRDIKSKYTTIKHVHNGHPWILKKLAV
jgi:hypothetical protein